MATLRLQKQAWGNENSLYESLINEATYIHGDDFLYLPRTYVAKNKILGEDRLSTFTNAYPLTMYLETVEGFSGSGAVMSKFGLQFDEQATVSVTRQTWIDLVGANGKSILPDRPAEGDLIFWPRTNALLEIMFVDHKTPFYQLGKVYSFKMTVEKFRYGGELIQTGNPCIDGQFTALQAKVGDDVTVPMNYGDNTSLHAQAETFVFDQNNPFGDL